MRLRTLLITGVSSGIGKEIAKLLLEKGHTVIGISRTCPNIQNKHFFFYSLDLSQTKKVEELSKKIVKEHPKVDGLICNAGIGHFAHLEQLSSSQIFEMMNVNFFSHAFLCKFFIPIFKKTEHTDIIFIGSEAALKGSSRGTIYCSSKFALRGFAQALRQECCRSNVRVASIQPGMTRTNFYSDLYFSPGVEEKNALLPEDIARAVEMIIELRKESVCEEIVLSPMKHVVKFQ